MVYLEATQYHGWNGYRAGNSYFEVIVIPEVGGRIMSFSCDGHEVLFTMPELRGKTFHPPKDIENIREYRKSQPFYLYGGYKTWLAPQDRWEGPPYIDLDSGPYCFHISEHTHKKAEFTMKSPVCRETGIQFYRRLRVAGDSRKLWVYQGMINRGENEVEFGLWDVTQVNGPGKVIFPVGPSSYEDGIKSFSPASAALKNQVVSLENGKAVIQCDEKHAFKYGTDYSEGWVSATIPMEDGIQVEFKKTFEIFKDVKFGHGCAIEVYDSGTYPYFEVEIHGPMTRLQPGEEFGFVEEWELILK